MLQAREYHFASAFIVLVGGGHAILIEQVVASGRIVHLMAFYTLDHIGARVTDVLLYLLNHVVVYKENDSSVHLPSSKFSSSSATVAKNVVVVYL
jgi:hypothetical protein